MMLSASTTLVVVKICLTTHETPRSSSGLRAETHTRARTREKKERWALSIDNAHNAHSITRSLVTKARELDMSLDRAVARSWGDERG